MYMCVCVRVCACVCECVCVCVCVCVCLCVVSTESLKCTFNESVRSYGLCGLGALSTHYYYHSCDPRPQSVGVYPSTLVPLATGRVQFGPMDEKGNP